ncbi:MAG: UDP-N-acetylmuramate dehydrogenase [Bacteroidales bacterium]|nr:UDP-N-acetylmuramate dehydrogenase [Bacteroidales bacterium]
MNIQRDYPLKELNTFGFNIDAKYYCRVASTGDICQAVGFCRDNGINSFVLGEGSNVLFTGDFNGMIIHTGFEGIGMVADNPREIFLKAGSGIKWDILVEYAVNRGLGGIENLSLIPGTVGAAPVQNIGAYGVEIADVLHSVEAVDLLSQKEVVLSAKDCELGYRNSIFKSGMKGRFLITSVTLRLSRYPELKLGYGNLFEEVKNTGKSGFGVRDVRDAVCRIRRSKLPDPGVLGNAGSFFKNPEVLPGFYEDLKNRFPGIIAFRLPSGNYKLAAGWLIETCGWKGIKLGNAGVYHKQALVIVNHGNARPDEILELADRIEVSVKKTFGVSLEKEVNVI